MQICQEMRPWVSLQISFIFAGKFNFETENTSKSIVQPPSPGLVVGSMHLQISFIVLFVPRQCQCKIPQKKPFHLQTESGLCRFIRVFPIDRFNFQGFANFKMNKFFTFSSSDIFLCDLYVWNLLLESDRKACSFLFRLLQLTKFNLWIEKWSRNSQTTDKFKSYVCSNF